ncbi:DMT family transporter [Clostridium omnivorum]|uniref:Membrane protein n=1 Tax=Clostridium omnivorum TaxID=1604902 RepID=A0ABQ5N2Q2_9CLOT|nr:DMT family transporter [Clostridium sp. E14]GLC29487.1 membrane protein [Clostridium sp. E14]
MKKRIGMIYALGSSAAFGLMPIFAKWAYKYGINSITLVILRFMFAWIIILPMLLYKKKSLKLNKTQLKHVLIIGGLAYTFTTLTLFLSYNYISVGIATTLHFIYPIIVTLISIVFFKEKVFKEKVIALTVSTIGILFLIYNGQVSFNFVGVFYALFSGILYSIYITGVEHSEMKNIDSFVLTFYLSVIAAFMLLAVGTFSGQIDFNLNIRCYIAAFLIALISTVIAITFFQKGIKIIGSSNASILSTFEPIVSFILGVIIYKEAVSFKIIVGCLLIFASVLLLTKGYSKHSSQMEHKK